MRKTLNRFLRLLLSVALLVGSMTLGALGVQKASQGESDFDRLLRLAHIADQQFDALPDTWEEDRPQDWFEFNVYVRTIVAQLVEENVSEGLFPEGTGFTEYGFVTRSMIAGTYSPIEDVVMLNSRYVSDPVWMQHNYLGVLIHELIHAQGYHNEAQTEAMTAEVIAAFANLNYPGMRREFWDNIRRDALSVAYYMAAYQGDLIHTSDPNEFGSLCLANCHYQANPRQMAQLQAAREAIFTEDELRRSDKRLRFWLSPQLGNRYLFVLAQYAVKPMALMLDVVCDGDYPEYAEKFKRELRTALHGLQKVQIQPQFQIDDVAYLMREAGFCH